MKISRRIVVSAVAAMLSVSVATPAMAANGSASKSLPAGVTTQGQQYLNTLTAAQRAQFISTELAATVTVTYTGVAPQDAVAKAEVAHYGSVPLALAASANGCWLGRADYAAKAAAGNTLYTYYHTGGWCVSGSTVYSPSTYEHGGETSTPGWHYNGVIGSGAGVISNQGRSYSQFKFTLSVGPWDVQTPTPCIRVNGLNNATYTSSGTCGVS
jgi:hypothetical protein